MRLGKKSCGNCAAYYLRHVGERGRNGTLPEASVTNPTAFGAKTLFCRRECGLIEHTLLCSATDNRCEVVGGTSNLSENVL